MHCVLITIVSDRPLGEVLLGELDDMNTAAPGSGSCGADGTDRREEAPRCELRADSSFVLKGLSKRIVALTTTGVRSGMHDKC